MSCVLSRSLSQGGLAQGVVSSRPWGGNSRKIYGFARGLWELDSLRCWGKVCSWWFPTTQVEEVVSREVRDCLLVHVTSSLWLPSLSFLFPRWKLSFTLSFWQICCPQNNRGIP